MDDGHRMNKRRRRDGDGAETPGPAKVAARAPEGVEERHSAAAVVPLMAVATVDWEDVEPPAEREAVVTDPVSGSSALGHDGAARGGMAAVAPSHGDRFRSLDLITTIPKGGDRLVVGSPVFFPAGGDVLSPGPIGVGQPAAARARTPHHRTLFGVLCARCGFGTLTVRFSPVEHLCLCNVCQADVNAVCLVCGLRGSFFS